MSKEIASSGKPVVHSLLNVMVIFSRLQICFVGSDTVPTLEVEYVYLCIQPCPLFESLQDVSVKRLQVLAQEKHTLLLNRSFTIHSETVYDTKSSRMTTDNANADGQQMTSEETTTSPPTEHATRTDQDIVNGWLMTTYLSYDLEDGTESMITISEFLDVVRTQHPECLMPEQTVNLALALSVKKWKRSNTIVISDIHAQRLYALGTEIDTRAELLRSCPTLQQTLLNPQKRWIIIACNDGIMDAAGVGRTFDNINEEDPAASSVTSVPEPVPADRQQPDSQDAIEVHEDSATAPQEEEQSNAGEGEPETITTQPQGPKQYGNHWGLLVIDKTEKIARWVDSAIDTKERSDDPNKLMFGTMHPAAIAAGKVLCGIDALLGDEQGFPKGGFTTSTLKYTPQQGSGNSYSGPDGGPCGPFMFAFLEYIFERATTLDRIGVQKMFPRRQQGQVEFNSMHARREIRKLIQQEGEKPDPMPFRLSPDLLRILNALPVEQLQRSVDAYQSRATAPASNRSTGIPPDVRSNPNFLAAFEQAKADNPTDYEGLEDGQAWKEFYASQRSIWNARGNGQAGRKKLDGSETGHQNSNTTEFYLGQDLYRNVPLHNSSIWPPHETDRTNWPKSFKRLPDFTAIGKTMLASWLNRNTEFKKAQNETTRRAMLHVKFKRTFLGEPDSIFEGVWSRDETVFDPNDPDFTTIQKLEDTRVRYGMMRLMMMRHYQGDEVVDALLKSLRRYGPDAPASGQSRKDDDDDGGSNDSGNEEDDDTGEENQNRRGNGGDPSGRADDGDRSNNEYHNEPQSNGDEDGANMPNENNDNIENGNYDGKINANSEANGVSLPTPAPLGIWDFRTMEPDELQTHITPQMRNDPRVKSVEDGNTIVGPNIVSWRALCFVDISGGRFDTENDKDVTGLWSDDPLVFGRIQRDVAWSTQVMREMMRRHYHPKKSSSSGTLDDIFNDFSEEGSSTEEDPTSPIPASDAPQAPAVASNTDGNKRKHNTAEISPNKKLKLSAPEFLVMPEGQLASWIQKMPLVFRNEFSDSILDFKDVRRARIWLERMFGEGFEHMRNEDSLSRESMHKLRQWRFKLVSATPNTPSGFQDFLHRTLLKDPIIGGKAVTIPDRRAELEKMRSNEGTSS